MLIEEAVRVVAIGHEAHFRTDAGSRQQLHIAGSCFQSGLIAIAKNDGHIGIALQQLALLLREGGAATGYCREAMHPHGDDIRVAFYQIHLAGLVYSRLVFVQPIQHLALVVEQALCAVDVLGILLVCVGHGLPAGHGHYPTPLIADGKKQAVAESAPQPARVK